METEVVGSGALDLFFGLLWIFVGVVFLFHVFLYQLEKARDREINRNIRDKIRRWREAEEVTLDYFFSAEGYIAQVRGSSGWTLN